MLKIKKTIALPSKERFILYKRHIAYASTILVLLITFITNRSIDSFFNCKRASSVQVPVYRYTYTFFFLFNIKQLYTLIDYESLNFLLYTILTLFFEIFPNLVDLALQFYFICRGGSRNFLRGGIRAFHETGNTFI